ncbi:hypothetical protein K474DRAFT_90458 [Panus rudis PR-1116 ss-1]|nr:hypothetical protein K474DRAFT_90458 [Panus rudis PR-1116 ss-1]
MLCYAQVVHVKTCVSASNEGILESILRLRLPISEEIRESRDPLSKVQAMKIFLGVLENDVLGEDVGLSDVDPRKLASGEWDEVVFIGELLCWLGKKHGLIPLDDRSIASPSPETGSQMGSAKTAKEEEDVRPSVASPSAHSSFSTRDSTITALSLHPHPPESDTTIHTNVPLYSPPLSELGILENSNVRGFRDQRTRTSSPIGTRSSQPPTATSGASATARGARVRTRRRFADDVTEELSFVMNPIGHSTIQIHSGSESSDSDTSSPAANIGVIVDSEEETGDEADSISVASSSVSCHCGPNVMTPTRERVPVRYEGYIHEVDDEEEIHSFEASRRESIRRQLAASTHTEGSQRSREQKTLESTPPASARVAPSGSSVQTPRYAGLSRASPSSVTPRAPAGRRIVTRHTSPSQHTLALLNERAKLAAELAHIKSLFPAPTAR